MPVQPPLYGGGPLSGGPIPPRHEPPAVRDPQRFAEETLRYGHDDALYQWGEYVMLVLLWTSRDFNEGLVLRCSRCYVTLGKITATYAQASEERCPVCFGTSYEGGYRARIIRPSLWTDTDDSDHEEERRGTVVKSTATVQTTSDFVLRRGDFIFRGDGSRWRLGDSDAESVTTGFDVKASQQTNVGSTGLQVMRLDESHVAYTITPTLAVQIETLDLANSRRPIAAATGTEELRGPLW